MGMCRFKSANVPRYIDFKAALTDYLNEIRAKNFAQRDQARQEAEQRLTSRQAGS
jgi:hypothetical protein